MIEPYDEGGLTLTERAEAIRQCLITIASESDMCRLMIFVEEPEGAGAHAELAAREARVLALLIRHPGALEWS